MSSTRSGFVEPALRFLVEGIDVFFQIRDQFLAMRRALFGLTERIQFEADAGESEVVPQTLAHHDDFGVGVRPGEAERLHADLMELAITPALRTLMTEHRTDVPQTLRAVVQQVVLDGRAHDRRGVLRAHRQMLAVERVGEAVHLLLDDVGHFADAAREQLRVLDDRRADVLIAVCAQHRLDGGFEEIPQRGILREDVVHALHAAQFLEPFLLFSHLSLE